MLWIGHLCPATHLSAAVPTTAGAGSNYSRGRLSDACQVLLWPGTVLLSTLYCPSWSLHPVVFSGFENGWATP
jgi:hypothetical protein